VKIAEPPMNDTFVSFLNDLKSRLTIMKFQDVRYKIKSNNAGVRDYFNLFIKECLDECPKIDYNTFSEQEKRYLDKIISRIAFPLIAKELHVA